MVITTIVVLITTTIVFPSNDVSANGWVVSGSTAVKNAVINSMETVGIKFTSSEAKEKAYDAWNMKAYEMWKEDEQNGRNAELWQSFIQETQRIESTPIQTLPDKPNFGKMLLESTWFGMAISIGANAGFAIQEAQIENRALFFLSTANANAVPGADYAMNIGVTYQSYKPEWGTFKFTELAYTPAGVNFASAQSVLENDPEAGVRVTDYEIYTKSGVRYIRISYELVVRDTDGMAVTLSREYTTDLETFGGLPIEVPPGKVYEIVPQPEHVPNIQPNPHVQPLIVPNPDISIVPDIIPHPEPVPVIVPIEPFVPNPHIEPYVPPGDIPEPEPEPEPPGDNPDKPVDPNTPPDKPPYVPPGGNPVPEITPEYPEEITDPEGTTEGGFFSKLWEWLKAILDALIKILNAIIALPFKLLELLWDFLLDIGKALFVPSDGFWDKNMNELKKVIWGDEMDDMIDDFESFASGGGGFFNDMVVSLMGVDGLVVIDADSINSILENIHSWVRGVIYPLLILFNVNSMYKLIRGTSLVEATRGLANRSKGAD